MSSPEPKAPAESPARRVLLLVAGVGLLVLAVGLMLKGQHLFGRSEARDEAALQPIPAFNATTVSGVGVVAPGANANLPQVGDPAPDFTLVDLDGNRVTMSELRGRPVILNFWATWCGPCRVEMPDLAALQAEHVDDDLLVLAVNQAESAEQVRAFLDELELDLTAVLDSKGEVADAYGAFFLPSTMFVDANGTITAFHRGIISPDQAAGYLQQTLPNPTS